MQHSKPESNSSHNDDSSTLANIINYDYYIRDRMILFNYTYDWVKGSKMFYHYDADSYLEIKNGYTFSILSTKYVKNYSGLNWTIQSLDHYRLKL